MNSYYLAEQSVFKSLFYLSEAMQYYWPSVKHDTGYLQEISENNIALHLARAFSENGFLVWAEVPFQKEKNHKVDFVAYNYPLKTLVVLELKNNIETPQNNYEDICRISRIYDDGLYNAEHTFNNQSISEAEHKLFGVVTILNATEFAEWWSFPNPNKNYMPDNRTADTYAKIGKAISVAPFKAVAPLCEYLHPEATLQYRFRRAGYALYDENGIEKLREILNSN